MGEEIVKDRVVSFKPTQENKNDAKYYQELGARLPNDMNYKFTYVGNLNNNGYKITSPIRISQLEVSIPRKYIFEDRIQIGDLVLTEVSHDEYKDILFEKFKKKIVKSIELSNKMLTPCDEQSKNTVVVPKQIYSRLIKHFEGQIPENKMRLIYE